jgi:hypothetical protein
LKEDGVKVWGVGPGLLVMDLGNMRGKVKEMGGGGHPSLSGKLIRSVIEGERGKIVNKDGLSPSRTVYSYRNLGRNVSF